MKYLSGKTQKRKTYTRYMLYFGVFLLLISFWPFLRKHIYPTIEPVVIGYSTAKESFSFFPEFFRTYLTSHQSLVKKQIELERYIELLENTVAEKDALLRENVQESSTTEKDSSRHTLVMYPLMEDITRIYSTILLSKGFKEGVTIGSLVYLRGHQAVCTIKEVYTSSSLCLLLTASGIVTEGVTSSSSITLSLVGRGGHFLADIARDTPVIAGETVYLRSNPTMVLGTVRQVANNNQDTSWHVFVEGAYNPVSSSVFYVQP